MSKAKAEGRDSLTAPEAKELCDVYGIPVPQEGLAKTADEAVKLAEGMGFPVVLKIVSPQILHKTEAGGVLVGVKSAEEARAGFQKIVDNAKAYDAKADIHGIQVQQMLKGGQEVIVGAVTDPSFGKLVAFGLGGILVEVLKDITFRLAPVSREDALSMLDGIQAAEMLKGVRGSEPVDREALATILVNVSRLVDEVPEIVELDLNPVFARPDGATAADVRIVLDFDAKVQRYRPNEEQILNKMNRIMKPEAVAVIGASTEDGKIGNSVMKNLINGGYKGQIYPVHPKLDEVLGYKAYKSVKDIPGNVDIAVFAIPAKFVAQALTEVGEKGIAGAILIPSGFAETGNVEGQDELVAISRKYDVRLMGPNIYGFYYTPMNLCATFCTPFDVKGKAALSSQSGGIGMAIIGFSRSSKMGVSAIVGLGNKSDIDEDDLLTFFEHDDNTQIVAMHLGRPEGRPRVLRRRQAGFEEEAGGRAEGGPHLARRAGRQLPHRGARRQRQDLRGRAEAERRHPRPVACRICCSSPVACRCCRRPKGENVVIITGAGGSGVLLSDACVDNGLNLMTMPSDLDAAFRKFIPPFGAAGNPVDITGGEPPTTYQNTVRLGLEDERIHSLILGYWHTIITPPMVFAKVITEVVEEMRAKGIDKPVVASLAGDVRGRGSGGLPLPARHRSLSVLDRNAGGGARRKV